MKALDILLLLLLLWGGYMGYKMGFVMELLSLVSFSVAKVISIKLLHIFKLVYTKWHGDFGTRTSCIIFGILFIIIVVSILLLGKLFRSKLQKTALRKADRLLGAVVGIGKWGFYISTFIWLASVLGLNLPDSYIAHTILFPIIQALSPSFISWLSGWFPIIEKLG